MKGGQGTNGRPCPYPRLLTLISKFSSVPDRRVLDSLTDVYFTSCQNQPYAYFHENAFRRRLRDGEIPDYLVLAFVASAARYLTHEFFETRQKEAIETFAQAAWLIILRHVFSSEQGLDLCGVQATNLLAIIDFTGTYHQSRL